MRHSSANQKRYLVICGIICIVISLEIFFNYFFILSCPDLINLWAAACLARDGVDTVCPLSVTMSIDGGSVLRSYPPWALPLFYWMAYFSLDTLILIWKSLSQILFACSGILVLYLVPRITMPTLGEYFWAIGAVLLWFPTYVHLYVGQVTILQYICFLTAIFCFNRGHLLLTGMLLAITAIKPQVLYLVYWVIFIKAFAAIKYRKVLVSFLSSLAILTVIGMFLRSHIESGFWPIRSGEVALWLQPNIGSFLQIYFQTGVWMRFLPAIVSLCIGALWARKTEDIFTYKALLFILPVCLITSPYTNAYDSIILLCLIGICGGKLSKAGNFTQEVLLVLLLLLLLFLWGGNIAFFRTIESFFWLTLIIWGALLVFTFPLKKQA